MEMKVEINYWAPLQFLISAFVWNETLLQWEAKGALFTSLYINNIFHRIKFIKDVI